MNFCHFNLFSDYLVINIVADLSENVLLMDLFSDSQTSQLCLTILGKFQIKQTELHFKKQQQSSSASIKKYAYNH